MAQGQQFQISALRVNRKRKRRRALTRWLYYGGGIWQKKLILRMQSIMVSNRVVARLHHTVIVMIGRATYLRDSKQEKKRKQRPKQK